MVSHRLVRFALKFSKFFLWLNKFLGKPNDCARQKFILGDVDQRLIDFTSGPSSFSCQAEPMFIPHLVRDAIKDRVQSQDTCAAEDRTSQVAKSPL